MHTVLEMQIRFHRSQGLNVVKVLREPFCSQVQCKYVRFAIMRWFITFSRIDEQLFTLYRGGLPSLRRIADISPPSARKMTGSIRPCIACSAPRRCPDVFLSVNREGHRYRRAHEAVRGLGLRVPFPGPERRSEGPL